MIERTHVLAAADLALRRGSRPILTGAALELRAGERASLCGPSGCGKTTLLRLLAGLEPADAGRVWCGGVLATDGPRIVLPPWRRGVQMVFQDLGLWPMRSARQHLLDAARAAGRSDGVAAAQDLLDRLGLTACAERRPATLSGGEARRLALARALITRPTVLLLDEPFASLDPDARHAGRALLEEVLRLTEAAVLLVSHDPSDGAALGGRTWTLRNGRIEA